MAKTISEIENLILPAVIALNCELVGCERSASGGQNILRVYVDAENGISLEQVTQVSRQISAVLDVEDPFSSHYSLEVSSPGIDRPLFKLEHYQRFVGQRIKLRLRQPLNRQRNFAGVLLSVSGETITLDTTHGSVEFGFSMIEKANLIHEFK